MAHRAARLRRRGPRGSGRRAWLPSNHLTCCSDVLSIDTLTLGTSTLREAQRGALYAIAAHRSTSDEPAQVVLPTGVGKTLVAVLAPYLLEARRVLVVTPARIVR